MTDPLRRAINSLLSGIRPKSRVGRPTLCEPAVTRAICKHIRAGASERAAAEASGVSYAAVMEWMACGLGVDPNRPSTPEFAEFAKAIRRARGHARVQAEIAVRKRNPLVWLYNRCPEDWKPPAALIRMHSGEGGLWDQTAETVRQVLFGDGRPPKTPVAPEAFETTAIELSNAEVLNGNGSAEYRRQLRGNVKEDGGSPDGRSASR